MKVVKKWVGFWITASMSCEATTEGGLAGMPKVRAAYTVLCIVLYKQSQGYLILWLTKVDTKFKN